MQPGLGCIEFCAFSFSICPAQNDPALHHILCGHIVHHAVQLQSAKLHDLHHTWHLTYLYVCMICCFLTSQNFPPPLTYSKLFWHCYHFIMSSDNLQHAAHSHWMFSCTKKLCKQSICKCFETIQMHPRPGCIEFCSISVPNFLLRIILFGTIFGVVRSLTARSLHFYT